MNTEIHNCRQAGASASGSFCSRLREAVAGLKERLIARCDLVSPNHRAEIRAAVTAAEEQAWETPFPHLFFPDFAEIRLAAFVAEHDLAYARAA